MNRLVGRERKVMKQGFVYILRSLKNGRFYIGSTANIKARLYLHKIGRVIATRYIRPLKLELCQEYPSFGMARRVEYRLKKFKRRDFIEKIIKDGVIKTK